MKKIFLANEFATIELGKKISRHLKPGMILNLVGDLGAGKTTITKGIIAGLGGSESDVSSPTFSLVHEYKTPKADVVHCDFYRLEPNNQLEDFGGAEFFFQPKIFIVEWLERVYDGEIINKNQLVTLFLQSSAAGRDCTLPEILEK